jgi:ribulose-5-phosphate 4-epimerase/fuculose-1-phosphate aldolase
VSREAQDADDLARLLCDLARSLFDRGLTPGTSGNISVRRPDGGFLVTPTNASLGRLAPERLAVLDEGFGHVGGERPTKELPLHRAFYATRGARAGAVVHLHSPFAVALSTLEDLDPDDVLPPLTPYPVMRLGQVRLLPYVAPGDPGMGLAVEALGGEAKAVLLASHGPVVADASLEAAVSAIEELEAAARLLFTLGERPRRRLGEADLALLRARFPAG